MYLDNYKKEECTGCEACANICPKHAITMEEDEEGFRYPIIDSSICVSCNLCRSICPQTVSPVRYKNDKVAFGGYVKDLEALASSTSGGAFSALVKAYNPDYVFGAEADGLIVKHSYIKNAESIDKYRQSKYSQSQIGTAYNDVKSFLKKGNTVLFSGTPCQIAGLKKITGENGNLLTIEVICEGVPSPLFIRKYNDFLTKKYRSSIYSIDYRFKCLKTRKNSHSGKWDFEVMRIQLNNKRTIFKDRWFNPFWSIWLGHLMSRPSCYYCKYASTARTADITLGDLWGVHLYCPELYNNNAGASLIVCNTEKGKEILNLAINDLEGHILDFQKALKYQGPLRKTIDTNINRSLFMEDLKSEMPYKRIVKKWAKRPSLELLFRKYIWGNRQKVFIWKIFNSKENNND